VFSPRIIILDGQTLNPGDLSWAPLEALGDCQVYPRTSPGEMRSRIGDAAVAITNKAPFDRDLIPSLPELKYIGVTATGYNIIDMDAARQCGVTVTNVPAYSTMSVAQTVFAHLLAHTHHVEAHTSSVTVGDWVACPDFGYRNFPLIELDGLTLGIIGFGQIGRAVARIGAAFGMTVIAHTRTPPKDSQPGVRFVERDAVFRESDVLTLHCPLTSETEGLVSAGRLKLMKPSAIVINTSRGGLVDEAALAGALNSRRIAGAGVDVLSTEPPQADNPLLSAKNITITPHLAWATQAARQRLLNTVAENLQAFLNGRPQNVVR